MGHVISSSCRCGYSNESIPIGAGRHNHLDLCMHPALCRAGQHMVTVNLKDESTACPDGHPGEPLPYCNAPELQGVPGNGTISSWGDHRLDTGTYLCPKCGRYEMRFSQDPGLSFD